MTGAQLGIGFAKRLKATRERRALSVRALAAELGVSYQTIVGYENGKGGSASIERVRAIAEVLRVPSAWLAYGTGPPAPD